MNGNIAVDLNLRQISATQYLLCTKAKFVDKQKCKQCFGCKGNV